MQCHSFDIPCCLLVCSLRVRAMTTSLSLVSWRLGSATLELVRTSSCFSCWRLGQVRQVILALLVAIKNRRFLHDRSSSAFANASFITSLRPSRRSAPCGVAVRLVSILLRHQSECPSLIALHLQRGTVCLNVLLGDSCTLKSHTVKLPWSRQHWVHSDFWSDHCPSSVCESPWHPSHVVDHFAPFAAIVWLRVRPGHSFKRAGEALCTVVSQAKPSACQHLCAERDEFLMWSLAMQTLRWCPSRLSDIWMGCFLRAPPSQVKAVESCLTVANGRSDDAAQLYHCVLQEFISFACRHSPHPLVATSALHPSATRFLTVMVGGSASLFKVISPVFRATLLMIC